jgi:hypothetical protein
MMLFFGENRRAAGMEIEFGELALSSVHGENHMSLHGMVEILADALDLLFRIALQRRGGLGMSERDRNFDLAHRWRALLRRTLFAEERLSSL